MNLVYHTVVQEMINLLSEEIELYKTSYEYVTPLFDDTITDVNIVCIPHLTFITSENVNRFLNMLKRDIQGVEVEPVMMSCIDKEYTDYLLTMSQEDSEEHRIVKAFGCVCIQSEFGHTIGYLTYERNIDIDIIILNKGLITRLQFEEYIKYYTINVMLRLLEKKMSTKTM
eukprot:TRINITY_DN8231_c0_g1_i1.p1 TRINITY_DN8231_c0_g1~~TRINITY_DN8231_c0_g1_i1.p1  ORF type:complete len:171 (+),score=25.21 TRINITY_DN8231_c0_g1_i1:89-601(+)